MRYFEGSGLFRRHERGIALVTVLVFMVILSIIGMAAMQSSGLQEKMSGNMRNQDVAFQAAETAVRQGELWVEQLVSQPALQSVACTGACEVVWDKNDALINGGNFTDHAFWDAGTNLRTGTAIAGVNSAPKLVVEDAGYIRDMSSSLLWSSNPIGSELYRVTARGTGETDEARSVIQTTYAKRF